MCGGREKGGGAACRERARCECGRKDVREGDAPEGAGKKRAAQTGSGRRGGAGVLFDGRRAGVVLAGGRGVVRARGVRECEGKRGVVRGRRRRDVRGWRVLAGLRTCES